MSESAQLSSARLSAMARQRKPWGSGPAELLKKKRQRRAAKVAGWILPNLKPRAIEARGSLFPRGCHKKKDVRRVCASWIHKMDGKGRYFTSNLLTLVCEQLVLLLGFIPPRRPTQPYAAWVASQAKRLGLIIRAAKKARYDLT